jgi:hypothetical protein
LPYAEIVWKKRRGLLLFSRQFDVCEGLTVLRRNEK